MDHAEFPHPPAPSDGGAHAQPVKRGLRKRRSVPPNWELEDKLPAVLPVTPAEVEIFEAYFGAILDELLAKRARGVR